MADSIQGDSSNVTVTLSNARDSVRVNFYYPDNNLETTVSCYPAADSATASKYLRGQDPPTLDSVGCYDYIAFTYTSGAVAETLIGQWCNFGSVNLEPGTGYKTYPCTLLVLNTADTTAISNVPVTIRPLGGGRELVVASTDVNGQLIYSSEAASISVFLLEQGWDFNAEDTLTIAGSQTDTLWGTALSFTASANQTAIFCWLLEAIGDTVDPSYVKVRPVKSADSLEYKRTDRLTVGTGSNKITIGTAWSIISSDTSLMDFDLFPNSSIYVNGTLDTSSIYEFIGYFTADEGSWESRVVIEVPHTTQFNPFAQ